MEGSEASKEDENLPEAQPDEGEIEEAVKDVDLSDSPEDATEGEESADASDADALN